MRAINVFRPEAAQAMSHAFDDVCAFLQIPKSAINARELIAKRIIELGRQGEAGWRSIGEVAGER